MTRLFMKDVAAEAARLAGVELTALLGERRYRHLARPRQRAMWACRKLRPDVSWMAVGRTFGRDHATVIHAYRSTEARILVDQAEAEACAALLAALTDRSAEAGDKAVDQLLLAETELQLLERLASTRDRVERLRASLGIGPDHDLGGVHA